MIKPKNLSLTPADYLISRVIAPCQVLHFEIARELNKDKSAHVYIHIYVIYYIGVTVYNNNREN